MSIRIAIIAGTRPEFIKLAPLIKLIAEDRQFNLILIHSGQHYDRNLSLKFFEDLELPNPNFNIEVGSGTHAYQTGFLMQEIEKIIMETSPDVVLAQGDTNTVLASSLATRKLNKCFMHLEAGIRSFDKRMPEEVNRIVTGMCSMYHFAPTERAGLNLLFEGVDRESIFIVGNTIVDSVLQTKELSETKSNIFKKLNIKNNLPIILITLHRPANVDIRENLKKFIKTIKSLNNFQFIFPIHPRTKKNLINFKLYDKLENLENVIITEPLGYLDFYSIFSKSLCVLTDSGGIQEEALILRVPCITLRNNTERPETLEYGSSVLVGMDMNKLKSEIFKIKTNSEYLKGKSTKNPFGDGKTSERIIQIVKELYNKNLLNLDQSKLWSIIPNRNLIEVEHLKEPITVKNYEIANRVKIQMLFNVKGVPCFPYDHKLIRNQYKILLNSN